MDLGADPGTDALALHLARSERANHGCYLGEGDDGPVFAAPEEGVLVLGPPRSNKTSAVVIPAVLSWCGPVVSASSKADVLGVTAGARCRRGECLLYDPTGTVPRPPGVTPAAWSPLWTSKTWPGALKMAEAMVTAARPGTELGEAHHWSERALALLATAFHAAAIGDVSVRRMVRSLEAREASDFRTVLSKEGTEDAEAALSVLNGILATEAREQSGIWSTVSGVMAAYRIDGALASTAGTEIRAAFVEGAHTLYICAGSEYQKMAAPLVVGLLSDLRDAAYERSTRQVALGGTAPTGEPPMLFALDELANIAPMQQLPSLVSQGGSQGVVTLACLQDLSQAREKWAQLADGFLSLFGTKVVFPGIGDVRTLEALSQLAGDFDRHVRSLNSIPVLASALLGAPMHSWTDSVRKERRLPVSALAIGRKGHVTVLHGAEPSFVRLTPWYRSTTLRAAAEGRRVTYGHDRAFTTERLSGRGRGQDRAGGRG